MPLTTYERNRLIRQLYLEGKSRKEVMMELDIRNTNTMSSISHSMGLHWSLTLGDRLATPPPEVEPVPATQPVSQFAVRRRNASTQPISRELPRAFPLSGEGGVTTQDLVWIQKLYDRAG